ncbi:hypothetical protein GCM10009599_28070 [Luteococcus peritonei]
MQFVNLRVGVHGRPAVWSLFLIGFTAVSVVTLPWLVRRGQRTRAGNLVLGAAVLLFGWALWSAWHTPLPRLFKPRAEVTRIYLVVPVVTSFVTLFAAWGLAAMIGPARRRLVLWQAAMLIPLSSVLAGARTIVSTHSVRLGTGMGGAAIFHVALLLAGAVLLASALRGERRGWSALGAALCLVEIMLTASRSGLLSLLVFGGLLSLFLLLRGRGLQVLAMVAAVVACAALAMVALPATRRLLQVHDTFRMANYETAWRTWSATGHNIWLGVGSGRMWPWYPFETGAIPVPWRGAIQTGFGRSLTNPHSLYLGVLAELGLVGLALLLVVVATVVWQAVRGGRRLLGLGKKADRQDFMAALSELVVPLALVATLVAFAFDHYLLKNFAISFWWWLVLACTWGLHPGRRAAERAARETTEVAG